MKVSPIQAYWPFARPNKNQIVLVKTTLSCVGPGEKSLPEVGVDVPVWHRHKNRTLCWWHGDTVTRPPSQHQGDAVSDPRTRHPGLRHQGVLVGHGFGDRPLLKRHRSKDIALARGRVCVSNVTLMIYSPTSQDRPRTWGCPVTRAASFLMSPVTSSLPTDL